MNNDSEQSIFKTRLFITEVDQRASKYANNFLPYLSFWSLHLIFTIYLNTEKYLRKESAAGLKIYELWKSHVGVGGHQTLRPFAGRAEIEVPTANAHWTQAHFLLCLRKYKHSSDCAHQIQMGDSNCVWSCRKNNEPSWCTGSSNPCEFSQHKSSWASLAQYRGSSSTP